MTTSKNGKLLKLLHSRLKITAADGRAFIGNMIAFDPYMNLVLADCEEFRRIRPKNPLDPPREEKRTLGLVILRGDNIVSMSVEAPPPPNEEARRKAAAQVNTGGGIGRPAGRGIGIMPPAMAAAPIGLAGPVRGVGGPMPQPPLGFRPPPGMPSGMPPVGARPPVPPPGFRPPPGSNAPMPPPGFRPPPGHAMGGFPPGPPPPGFRPAYPPGMPPRPPQ